MEVPEEKHRIIPERSACMYTSCYCEENIWQLCKYLSTHSKETLEPFYAVFISNPTKSVLLFEQRSGRSSDGICIWDYHVILVGKSIGPKKNSMVWDLDSKLDYPVAIDVYYQHALKSDNTIRPRYRRKFRVIPASDYLNNFASDRRHMKKQDGGWMMPPPPYEPIRSAKAQVEHNLDSFIDMTKTIPGFGQILDGADQLQAFFS